jgi:membrane-bound ClpP family serine protease
MWIIGGVLLGLVCLATIVGVHSGPHARLVAWFLGAVGAEWLVFMIVIGGPGPVQWSLLGAGVVLGAGAGVMARKARSRNTETESIRRNTFDGAEGVAFGDLTPEGIVCVRGVLWSAISLNGTVPDATPVQVLRVDGVRLEVWGEYADAVSTEGLFDLDEGTLEHIGGAQAVRVDGTKGNPRP